MGPLEDNAGNILITRRFLMAEKLNLAHDSVQCSRERISLYQFIAYTSKAVTQFIVQTKPEILGQLIVTPCLT